MWSHPLSSSRWVFPQWATATCSRRPTWAASSPSPASPSASSWTACPSPCSTTSSPTTTPSSRPTSTRPWPRPEASCTSPAGRPRGCEDAARTPCSPEARPPDPLTPWPLTSDLQPWADMQGWGREEHQKQSFMEVEINSLWVSSSQTLTHTYFTNINLIIWRSELCFPWHDISLCNQLIPVQPIQDTVRNPSFWMCVKWKSVIFFLLFSFFIFMLKTLHIPPSALLNPHPSWSGRLAPPIHPLCISEQSSGVILATTAALK